jgi:hypothetical protein
MPSELLAQFPWLPPPLWPCHIISCSCAVLRIHCLCFLFYTFQICVAIFRNTAPWMGHLNIHSAVILIDIRQITRSNEVTLTILPSYILKYLVSSDSLKTFIWYYYRRNFIISMSEVRHKQTWNINYYSQLTSMVEEPGQYSHYSNWLWTGHPRNWALIPAGAWELSIFQCSDLLWDPPSQWVLRVLSPGVSGRGMKLTTHPHLVLRLRTVTLPPLPIRLHVMVLN